MAIGVCMICLDTDSKLLLMSKHKLEEAYEKLTGQPLSDQGNLKHTICVQCAQRLINFSRFRDKSLRARALMMDLVEKHEIVTIEHIQMINRTKHQLNSNMVLTTLGPDHCDLHILEHPSEDKQAELGETGHQFLVKIEGNNDSMSVNADNINEDDNNADNFKDTSQRHILEHVSEYNQKELEESRLERIMKVEGNDESTWVDEDMEMKNEADNNVINFVRDPLKYESVCFQCTHCLQEFVHEHAYMQHMSMHLQPDPSPSVHSAQTLVAPLPASLATNNKIKVSPTEEADTDVNCQYNRLTDSGVKLYNVFSKKVVPRRDETLKKTRKAVRSCVSQNIVSKDVIYQATSQNKVLQTESLEPVIKTLKALQKAYENSHW
nr:uncharacterized protein LOC117994078 [Maniola hyperantus]